RLCSTICLPLGGLVVWVDLVVQALVVHQGVDRGGLVTQVREVFEVALVALLVQLPRGELTVERSLVDGLRIWIVRHGVLEAMVIRQRDPTTVAPGNLCPVRQWPTS